MHQKSEVINYQKNEINEHAIFINKNDISINFAKCASLNISKINP